MMKKLFFRALILMFTLVLTNCTDDLHDIELTSERNEISTAGRIKDDTISNFFVTDYISSQNNNLVPQASLRGSNELIDEAIKQLTELDLKKRFIKNVVRKFGYPIWDRSTLLYAKHREEVLIIPFAFPESESTTAYFIALNVEEKLWFTLVKKKKLNKAIKGKGSLKNWENLPFAVLKSVMIDKDLFGYNNKTYIDWLLAREGNETGLVSGLRSCTSTEITVCEELVQALVNSRFVCTTYYQSVCDTPGGESGRCQECNGNDNDSDSTSGGSSGNNGTGTSNDLLPYYDGISDAEMVSNLDGIFQLSSSQESYLIANPAFLETFYDSYNSTTNQQNRADVMYSTLLSEATFPVNHLELAFEIGYLALENPSWPRWRVVGAAYLNVALNQTHTALDLIGLIPGLGEPADFINAGLYIIEGDGANATISLLASTPFGWVATTPRLVFKVVKKADGVTGFTLRMLKDNNGTIRFVTKNGVENSGQLKAIMQTKVGQQAHHIIPWAKRTNPIIQKAAKSGKFHINDTFNGINLDLSVHKGYSTAHRTYDTNVQSALNEMNNRYRNEDPDYVYSKLSEFVDDIRSQLESGKKLDQVIISVP